MNEDFIRGLLIGLIIPFILQLVIKDLYSLGKSKLNFILPKKYIWKPEIPLENPNAVKNINTYPKDFKINFKTNNIDNIEKSFVQGEEALFQHLIIYINTPKGEYQIYENTSYGNEQANTIFIEKNINEFQRQCERMMSKILKEENYKDYIEKVYSIERKKDKLYIETKLCGKGSSSIIVIPKLKSK